MVGVRLAAAFQTCAYLDIERIVSEDLAIRVEERPLSPEDVEGGCLLDEAQGHVIFVKPGCPGVPQLLGTADDPGPRALPSMATFLVGQMTASWRVTNRFRRTS